MATTYEVQVVEEPSGFAMVVTIGSGTDFWTSRPGQLTASTWDEAEKEAAEKVKLLRTSLEGT